MNKYKVKILPDNIEMLVEENTVLKEVFTEGGIKFEFPCGGAGKCKKCKVKIKKEGEKEEEVLACQTEVKGDLVVEIIKREQKHHILEKGVKRQVVINPLVKKVYLELPHPSIQDNRADWTRLIESLGQKGLRANLKVLRDLPEKLRKSDFKSTVVIAGDEVVAVESEDTTEKLLGMAFDIGTTTIVGYLMNLNTGQELTHVSSINPQTKYGADVISRIIFASQSAGGLEKLHKEVVMEINSLIEKAVEEAGYKSEDVYAITVAGNTTMHHLFLKIQPRYLASAPYVPVVKEKLTVGADDIGIRINPAGKVFLLPNIAGFVGADTVAAALAAEMDKAEELKLLIDIGTNGEIVLGTKERLYACSTAAGPAFEGAHISCGMRGATGAIDHVSIGEEYKYTVIGDTLPAGICGSGLLDAVAELLKIGVVDTNGRILKPDQIRNKLGGKYKDRIVTINGILSFLLEKETATGQPVYISQKDIRELQLAKGAIAAGIEVLLKTYGAKVEDIKEVLLAGAFGNYLNPESACRVGLIPPELRGKIKGIGNAAGVGAKLALLSKKEFKRAEMLSQKIKYIELSAVPEFSSFFAKKISF
ncbi:MAG: ASKHA domain-containing protein [Thermovenabulum sp.]|uniref:ASKHA domain-containing protein n=1 Tax=Thermovenabulum sp. TaxID=3100335 RepID=UPI003C7A8C5D